VAVICSVLPATTVEWSDVTVTSVIVAGGGGVGVVGLLFLQESIKQAQTKRPDDKENLFISPPYWIVFFRISLLPSGCIITRHFFLQLGQQSTLHPDFTAVMFLSPLSAAAFG
jgi:hypothetical protein